MLAFVPGVIVCFILATSRESQLWSATVGGGERRCGWRSMKAAPCESFETADKEKRQGIDVSVETLPICQVEQWPFSLIDVKYAHVEDRSVAALDSASKLFIASF